MEALILSGKAGNFVEVGASSVKIHSKILREKEKTIPFSSIVSVQLKKPALMTAGYIYFQTVGGMGNGYKTVSDIARDENSWILTNKNDYEIAIKMKERFENWRPDSCSSGVESSADEILKYKNLLDMGAITQEEFETKKKQLLGL